MRRIIATSIIKLCVASSILAPVTILDFYPTICTLFIVTLNNVNNTYMELFMKNALGNLVGIPPRNRKINLDSKYVDCYYKNNPYLTTFWNCLSLLFPQGEKFFVDSVKNYRDKITNDKLLAEISGFIGQESFHSREHLSLNDLIQNSGINVDIFDADLKFILDIARKLPPSWQLAATCALEHYTGIMGHQLLEDSKHNSNILYEYHNLWIWHAIEECEHKAVSYDVYKQVSNSYLLRVIIMLAASVVFFAVVANFYLRMLWQKKLTNPIMILDAVIYLSNLFKDLIPNYLEYFKPNFHPLFEDSSILIAQWSFKLGLYTPH